MAVQFKCLLNVVSAEDECISIKFEVAKIRAGCNTQRNTKYRNSHRLQSFGVKNQVLKDP